MDYYDLRDIKSYFRSADFILISDGRFIANLGLEYPFPLTKFISEETKETDITEKYRSFERAAVYCCKRTDTNCKSSGQLVTGINIMPMITATRNLHVYFETDDVTGPAAGRRCYNSLLEEVRTDSYDIVLTFAKAFIEGEVDGVISEIRKYVPVILVDEDEKFNFLDVLKG